MDESPVPCMVQGDFWEEYVMKKIAAKMIAVMRECSHIAKKWNEQLSRIHLRDECRCSEQSERCTGGAGACIARYS